MSRLTTPSHVRAHGHRLAAVLLGAALGIGAPPTVQAQQTTPTAAPPPAQASPEHLQQLENCRHGILDAEARPEERQRWAAQLLTYDSTEAQSLVAELLGQKGQPAARIALCIALANCCRVSPERIDPAWADPLIAALGAEDETLRARAAEALAEFPSDGITAKLAALAQQADAPLTARLAAIDALGARTQKRDVVARLMELLDREEEPIRARVLGVLQPITEQEFGSDLKRWREWWAQQMRLDEQAWLTEQVRVQRARNRALEQQQRATASHSTKQISERSTRIVELQRELFRALPPDQREPRLAQWLSDPLSEVKQTALSIISSRIADEGYRPGGDALTALLRLLDDPSVALRLEVLNIVPHVSDAAASSAALARLKVESDQNVKGALFAALGKLAPPEALPLTIREIADPTCGPECLREAANALGLLAARHPGHEALATAITPLKERYAAVSADDIRLRAALLTAMAGIGNAAFAPEFVAAVDSDLAELTRPALRGLSAVKDKSKLPRFRALTGHADARVRLAACDALGALGQEDADLEALLSRLNPALEQDSAAREAAWSAFRTALGRRPVADRLAWSERLRDIAGLELDYLRGLEKGLAGSNGTPGRDAVRRRLAEVLMASGNFTEAAGQLRDLYASLSARGDAGALDAGLRWLNATLRSEVHQNLAGLIEQLTAATPDPAARQRIVATVAAYADEPGVAQSPERTAALLGHLEKVPAEPLGAPWAELLQRLRTRLQPPVPKGPAPPPEGQPAAKPPETEQTPEAKPTGQ